VDSIFRAVFCAFLLAACAACTNIPFGYLFRPSEPNPAAQMPALETHIFSLVQDQRRKLDPKAATLAFDPELAAIARRRSADMAKNNSFTGSGDPHASATMLMAADANFQGLVGENVAAQHYRRETVIDPTIFAQRFVDTWLASRPHKDNLSFADYNRTGVGAAVNADTIYVTQLFSTDLGLGSQGASAPPPQVKAVASPQEGKDDNEKVPLRGDIMPSGAH